MTSEDTTYLASQMELVALGSASVHGFDSRSLARVIASEIAAASRALEFARERYALHRGDGEERRTNAIRLQYCEAWVKSLTTIARSLP